MPLQHALTGFSGAARITPVVRYKKAMVYATDLAEEAFSELSLKAVATSCCSASTMMVFFMDRPRLVKFWSHLKYSFTWICKDFVGVVKKLRRRFMKGLLKKRGNKKRLQSIIASNSIQTNWMIW